MALDRSLTPTPPILLLQLTQRFDVEIVFNLSLAHKGGVELRGSQNERPRSSPDTSPVRAGLQSISCLENCINLIDLDLSCNAITK